MKHLISLIVLVQVGSELVVNPQFVVGVKATGGSLCKAEIILNTGTSSGEYPSICSDWSPDKIEVALTKVTFVK